LRFFEKKKFKKKKKKNPIRPLRFKDLPPIRRFFQKPKVSAVFMKEGIINKRTSRVRSYKNVVLFWFNSEVHPQVSHPSIHPSIHPVDDAPLVDDACVLHSPPPIVSSK
jgi:hypothetical protein